MAEHDNRPAWFVERLEALEPGDRARLKRNAGQPLAEARNALGLFYRILPPGVLQAQENAYFLIATLYPLADGGGRGDFGQALRRARSAQNRRGLDRRIEILLDADETQMSFRLRQSVCFLQSCRVRIDWTSLLEDALRWNHPERFVQRKWARSYFAE